MVGSATVGWARSIMRAGKGNDRVPYSCKHLSTDRAVAVVAVRECERRVIGYNGHEDTKEF